MIKIKHYLNHSRTLQELNINKDFIEWFNVWATEEPREDEVNKIKIPSFTRLDLYTHWWNIVIRVPKKELTKFLSYYKHK